MTGRTVAVIGSGPAGLACAQQLTRAGHTVTVYERADRAGGLLRYGIPEFKMEKRHLDRRLGQMRAEGTTFRTGTEIGAGTDAGGLRLRHDAVVVAIGAHSWRELAVPGRQLTGIHQAMEYLTLANRVCDGDIASSPLTAAGRDVVIVGGGDTGADCLGTVLREGAASVAQLDINPRPGEQRAEHEPWPMYPRVFRVSPPTRRPGSCTGRPGTSGCSRRPPCASRGTARGGSRRCGWPRWSHWGAPRARGPSGYSRPNWCFWPWGSTVWSAAAG